MREGLVCLVEDGDAPITPEVVMDERRMLEECARLRGHVVAGLRESDNIARLLDGAILSGAADGADGADGQTPAAVPPLGGGWR